MSLLRRTRRLLSWAFGLMPGSKRRRLDLSDFLGSAPAKAGCRYELATWQIDEEQRNTGTQATQGLKSGKPAPGESPREPELPKANNSSSEHDWWPQSSGEGGQARSEGVMLYSRSCSVGGVYPFVQVMSRFPKCRRSQACRLSRSKFCNLRLLLRTGKSAAWLLRADFFCFELGSQRALL